MILRRFALAAALLGPTGCAPADDNRNSQQSEITESLASAARVSALSEVCPTERFDDLCSALHSERYQDAANAIALKAQTDTRDTLYADPAVRFYLRERAIALLVHNALTNNGADAPPEDYGSAAANQLHEHFPAYPPYAMPMSLRPQPPRVSHEVATGSDCENQQEAIVLFPGVVRLGTRQEFREQFATLQAHFPCVRLIRVDTGSFVAPARNAQQGERAIIALDAQYGGAMPLHLIGYSQGVRNALQTLVN